MFLKIDKWDWLLLFCAAFIIRLAYIAALSPDEGDSADSIYYIQVGNNIAEGKGHYQQVTPTERNYSAKSPLYPLLIAGMIKIFGNNLFWLRFVQSLMGSLTCIFVYMLGKELFNLSIGRLSGLIFTFYPFAIYYCGYIGSEALFVTIFTCFAWLFFSPKPDSARYKSAICGLLIGLSVLTRPIPMYLPLFLFIGILLQNRDRKSALKPFAVLVLVMVLTLMPWWLRNLKVFRQVVLTTTEAGFTLFAGNNIEVYSQPSLRGTYWIPEKEKIDRDSVSEVDADRIYGRKGLSFIRENPGRFLHLAVYKFVRFWRLYPQSGFSQFITRKVQMISILSYGVLLPFFILGFILSFKNWKKFIYAYVIISYFCALSMVFYGSTRLRFPIEFFVIVFASSGILAFYNWVVQRRSS